MYDYGARNYDPAIGRWMNIDPLAETNPDWTPYRYGFNNPLVYTDPTGMLESTHTDEIGNVVAVYDDGDLGVYKHDGNRAEAKKSVDANYSSKNTSAGVEKMGETWTSLGFADFNAYSKGEIKPAPGAKIDFDSNWATDMVSGIASDNPTLAGYANKARSGKEYDIKTQTPDGNVYYGSKLYGKYASARDAGNFAAGMIAQGSIVPNIVSDYGFGTYNVSGNSVMGSLKMIGADLLMLGGPISRPMAPSLMSARANYGEHPLSRAGIEAGKEFHRKYKK